MSNPHSAGAARPDSLAQLSWETLIHAPSYGKSFLRAQPFRHVLMDSFFEEAFAERLLGDFPPFDPALAKNEIYGGVWGKAANPRIRAIGPVYGELYELIESRAFLDWIGEMTGISGLVFDPPMYGGGTHENLHGQDLDPHVDFNYDEAQQLHRRLNLIVYLNKGWKPEWGGALELHSNPRKPEENRCESYSPIFNRAVLFETNEHSWHGFPRIELPPAERHRSRKSVSIYLYTRQRPKDEIAPVHRTFYVQRPLPDFVKPGHILSEDECRELRHAADRRDKWIESYQRMELEKSGLIAQHAAYLREIFSRLRAPLTGYWLQEGASAGFYADGWVQPRCGLKIRPLRPVTAVRVRGWRPEYAPASALVTVEINGAAAVEQAVGRGLFEVEVSGPGFPLIETSRLEIKFTGAFRPEGDDRDLAFVLVEIRAEHEDGLR